MTLPPDPFVLAVIMVLVGVAWIIAIGVRSSKAHVLEIIAIVVLLVGGIGLYGAMAAQFIFGPRM